MSNTEVVKEKDSREHPTYLPSTDIYETQEGLVLLADMPGVSEKNLTLELNDGNLIVEGLVDHHEPEGHELAFSEYRVGNYRRTFSISGHFDLEKIDATMKHGVLRVVLPKAESAKPRRIPVKSN